MNEEEAKALMAEAAKQATQDALKDETTIKNLVQEVTKELPEPAPITEEKPDSKEKAVNFVKALFARAKGDNKIAIELEKTGDLPVVNGDGAYTAPTEFKNKLIESATETTPLLEAVTRLSSQAQTVNWPKAGDLSPDDVETVAEMGTKPLAVFEVGNITATKTKKSAIVPVPDELIKYANWNVVATVANRLGRVFGQKAEYSIVSTLVGNSSVTPLVWNDENVQTLIDKARKLRYSLKGIAKTKGVFIMNSDTYDAMLGVKNSNNDWIFGKPNSTDPDMLWGRKVILSDYMKSIDNAIGDDILIAYTYLPAVIHDDDGDVSIDVSNQASLSGLDAGGANVTVNLFQQNATAWRGEQAWSDIIQLPTENLGLIKFAEVAAGNQSSSSESAPTVTNSNSAQQTSSDNSGASEGTGESNESNPTSLDQT